MRNMLIFGENFVGGAKLDPMVAVAASLDETGIHSCNGLIRTKIAAWALAGGRFGASPDATFAAAP
jgi:hypothetical protein